MCKLVTSLVLSVIVVGATLATFGGKIVPSVWQAGSATASSIAQSFPLREE